MLHRFARGRRALILPLAIVTGLALWGAGRSELVVIAGARAPEAASEALARTAAPPAPYAQGRSLYELTATPIALRSAPGGALSGWLSPAVIPLGDGRVVYQSWRELQRVDRARSWGQQGIELGDALSIPDVRVVSATEDRLLATGEHSLAVASDGRLATVRGVVPEYRAGQRYDGDVVVRASVDAADVSVWTSEPGRYVVAAWARDTLIAYRVGEGEYLSLVAFDGPGRMRELYSGTLVALSPDGARAFVEGTDHGDGARILDVATGRSLASYPAGLPASGIDWLSYTGSWAGDRVVARASGGLTIFDVSGDAITLERVIALDESRYPTGVTQPRFVDDAATSLVAWGDRDGAWFMLVCARAGACSESSIAGTGPVWPAADQSRP